MRRDLGDGLELDDSVERVDLDAVHRFLSEESYWARGRPREVQKRLVSTSTRVVGLYHEGRQVGFCRAVSDGVSFVYLTDVYVLAPYRGRGHGIALLRAMIEDGPLADLRWFLHTKDMHGLYGKLGFGAPGERTMERSARRAAPDPD